LLYLTHDGAEHILAFAPTRSGKGVGLVIPTLLSWRHSTVVLDIKGENYALTAGWRRKYLNHICLRFDPSSLSSSVKFNPVEEIRFGTDYEVGDAQNLALMIADPYGEGFKSHWDRQAYSLITGLIIFDLHEATQAGQTANLPRIANLFSDPKRSEAELFVAMLNCSHPVVASVGRDMLDKPDEERGSVVSTAKGHLVLYKDPIVSKNISRSEFKLSDLMNHDKPVDLYLVLNPKDKQRLMPIIRILISQIVTVLCPELQFEAGRPKENFKHRLLLLLDEFPALGKIEVIENALGFLAGYGIKAYLICQDLEQLLNAYGEKENITSNVHIQSVYAPNKPRTAKYISDACGVTTVVKKSISVSGSRIGLFLKNTSQNMQEIRRELLTPDEVRRLPAPQKEGKKIVKAGDMLVFVAGHPPIYGRQILYFLDPVFSERVKVEAEGTDIIRDAEVVNFVDVGVDSVDAEDPTSKNDPSTVTDSEGKIKRRMRV
jgi:type IV secretion system protein VirD4